MNGDPFELDIAHHVWETRYRYRLHGEPQEDSLEAGWRRVARALASVERREVEEWEARFLDLLRGFRFLPGGRILAGAGTALEVTLFNCFVMGRIDDSMDAMFDSLKEGALTMQQGGGVGYDFSTLRPRGAVAWRVGGVASGPVSFMAIWDAMCDTLLSTAARRGAMMGTLRCDHPDILEFIDAKRESGRLHNFNLSVLATDAFLAAVRADEEWPLVFPAMAGGEGMETLERRWPGYDRPVRCRIWRRLRARELWERIMRAAYDTAEPGVLFIDRINRLDNLHYREEICATNPCGEIPLPPYGACDLGALNLVCFVRDPFTEGACFDFEALDAAVPVAVRMLDNVIGLSLFPLPQQQEQARGSRRIGLGLTGLADALIMLGLHYASAEARVVAGRIMARICHGAYRASVQLAQEKGAFPFLEAE
ncbi:MAG TPA: adenosylcobalamin-dependent ribonucleoside-diphosphate reductase, partial [Chromatiales bacterium]|nr:adenosylcobalamin-dependent ribonucleoside-diphosphate reductase [Chromatiales bacterium]